MDVRTFKTSLLPLLSTFLVVSSIAFLGLFRKALLLAYGCWGIFGGLMRKLATWTC